MPRSRFPSALDYEPEGTNWTPRALLQKLSPDEGEDADFIGCELSREPSGQKDRIVQPHVLTSQLSNG